MRIPSWDFQLIIIGVWRRLAHCFVFSTPAPLHLSASGETDAGMGYKQGLRAIMRPGAVETGR
jgi:hypothetical protein